MQNQAYKIYRDKTGTRFNFRSVGKKGIVEKVVLFTEINDFFYNLTLMDYYPENDEYSDISVSDNGDMSAVIITVIAIVKIFLKMYRYHTVYFEGSTPVRNRLYHIIISKIYESVKSEYEIQGNVNGQWRQFEYDVSFGGFLIWEKL